VEWQVFSELEPFGERGDYLRTWMLAQAMVAPYQKNGSPGLQMDQFVPGIEPKRQTVDEAKEILRRFAGKE